MQGRARQTADPCRRRLAQSICAGLSLLAPVHALEQAKAARQDARNPDVSSIRDDAKPALDGLSIDVLRRADRLCQRGVSGLVDLQTDDGSFRLGSAINPAPLAIDALSMLALLATGHVPGRGRHGRAVERCLLALVQRQDRTGGPTHGYFRADGDEFSKMHGHGYATLALSQVLGMLPRDQSALVPQGTVRTALIDALRLIEKSQDRSGGWSYNPVPLDHEGSMTICMLQALRGARDAGLRVDTEIVARAVRYVERSQKPDGSFRYKLGVERSSVALTAAAVMTLHAGGQYESPVLRKGLAFLTDNSNIFRARTGVRVRETERDFPFYERLYIAEALFSAREQASFVRWFRRIVPELESSMNSKTKTWSSERYGDAYATAMTLLVLSLPFQYLPIHQR